MELGKRLFNKRDLSPVRRANTEHLHALTVAERQWVLAKLTPYRRIYALRDCLDRDMADPQSVPWT